MSEEDTKVADLFDKDIENFGNDLDKMIEHLNIVIATHNKQVEEIERLNNALKEYDRGTYCKLINENRKLNNIINELKEWFKGYHKSYAGCKWYEEDYIEFIEHLENELKGSDKE